MSAEEEILFSTLKPYNTRCHDQLSKVGNAYWSLAAAKSNLELMNMILP